MFITLQGSRGFIKKRIYLFYIIKVKKLYNYVNYDPIIGKYMYSHIKY